VAVVTKVALRNLSKSYESHEAVRGINLEIPRGEFLSLLGPSGCGKTTTLRMLAGFITPSAGSIELNGQVISTPSSMLPPEHRRMSMIFQSYAIWPNMTVRENVGFGLSLQKLPTGEIAERVNRGLAVVRLSGLEDRYPSELSGGQQQRVALARAMVIEPEVLLFDEPLSNLDAALREEMRYEILRLRDQFEITAIYVTHDQAEALALSDRIVVMNRGMIEQVADPITIYRRPRSLFVATFFGLTNVLRGRKDGSEIVIDGIRLIVPAALDLANGADVTISVRPKNIAICTRDSSADGRQGSRICARVLKCNFLGDYWDYLVTLESSGVELRVHASSHGNFQPGEAVDLHIDPEGIAIVPNQQEELGT
jgi:iron(III) transport system ATP-binding protein